MLTVCVNHMTVEGRTPKIRKFLNQITRNQTGTYFSGKRSFSLNSLIPMPRHIRELPDEAAEPRYIRMKEGEVVLEKQYSCQGDWCVRHWGCSSDVLDQNFRKDMHCKSDLKSNTGSLSFSFETRNVPPYKWLEEIFARFPELTFRIHYEMRGQFSYGHIRGLNGEMWRSDTLTESADIFTCPDYPLTENQKKCDMTENSADFCGSPCYGDIPF